MNRFFIFDFDQTLTLEHTRNHPGSGVRLCYREATNALTKKANLRNPALIKSLWQTMLEKGDKFAIASFHEGLERSEGLRGGVEYICDYLKPLKLITLDYKIPIVSHAENRRSRLRKNEHIEELIDQYNALYPLHKIDPQDPESAQRVVLIDDSQKNIDAAKAKGYKTIKVELDLSNVQYLIELSVMLETTLDKLSALAQSLSTNNNLESRLRNLSGMELEDLVRHRRKSIDNTQLVTPDIHSPRKALSVISPRKSTSTSGKTTSSESNEISPRTDNPKKFKMLKLDLTPSSPDKPMKYHVFQPLFTSARTSNESGNNENLNPSFKRPPRLWIDSP